MEAYNAYLLLTNKNKFDLLDLSVERSGLKLAEFQHSLLTGIGGVALKSPLSFQDIKTDIFTRAGGIQKASSCPETFAYEGLNTSLKSDFSYSRVFQDSFSLAQVYRERLIVIRDELEAGLLTLDGDAWIPLEGLLQN